jgi:PhnB protein
MAFHPYLAFAGSCREAFTRYQEIFGGELVLIPMSEAPAEDGSPPIDPGKAGLILHAALTPVGQVLMGADDPSGGFDGRHTGMCVNYSVADVAEAKRVFDALAEGGSVQMPIQETFFSPAFGMCTDRFATPWMVNTEAPAAPDA